MATALTPEAGPRQTPRWLQQLPHAVAKALEPLSPYERKFVQLYCGDCHGNGVLAVQILRSKRIENLGRKLQSGKRAPAGKKLVKQVSYSVAASTASMMLRRPHIRLAVNSWMEAFALSAAEVTSKIADLCYANMSPFVSIQSVGRGKKKKLVPMLSVHDEQAWHAHQHWIKEVETDKRGKITRLVLHDAFAAQREAAKILKVTSDQQPAMQLTMHFLGLSDDEVLEELARAHAEVAAERYEEQTKLVGSPVAVIPATTQSDGPTKKED